MSEWVTLTCPRRDDVLIVRAGEAITPGGGVGGTSTVDLPRDTAAVHWETHPPYTLAVDLVLDGFAEGRSVEGDAKRLLRMARAVPGEARPPSVDIDGPVPQPHSSLSYLIETIDWGDVMRPDDGSSDSRVRQKVTVNLIQDSRAELSVYRRKTTHAKTYTWRKGDTLTKVAHAKKVRGGTAAIKRANRGIRDWRHVRAGTRIKLP